MSLLPEITSGQLLQSALAVPAFVPVFFCPGYLVAWLTNLYGFRQQSIVERVCWSLPLSIGVSSGTAYLIGRFASLTAAAAFFAFCSFTCLACFVVEAIQRRRTQSPWPIGLRPFGAKALFLVVLWVLIALFSLVDIQRGQQLFMNVALVDQSVRIHWIETVLRTGVPPDNPMFMFGHSAPMRNYYFWYVVCAAVARLFHISARAVSNASSVWSGLAVIALGGIYLKHFLHAGARLRHRFLNCIWLLLVCGLDIVVLAVDLFGFQITPPADFDIWSEDAIFGWINSFLWTPHHVASLVCCMLAFLLASLAVRGNRATTVVSTCLIAFTLASAFGLSVYVTLAFFMTILVWSLWQLVVLRTPRSSFILAASGTGACILLLPYLHELTLSQHKLQDAPNLQYGMHGGLPLQFAVRQMIPPESLLGFSPFAHLSVTHPLAAFNLAKLLLLVPGYALELGVFFVVLVIYAVPRWRGSIKWTPEHLSFLYFTLAVFPFISLIRSYMVPFNDFGFRGALLVQFSLWLFTAEFVDVMKTDEALAARPSSTTPRWLRSLAALTLAAGLLGGIGQTVWDRTVTLLADWNPRGSRSLSHNAYISAVGYSELNRVIPPNAVVQFNPGNGEPFWAAADQVGVVRQNVITGYAPDCGAEIGGDRTGCPQLASAIKQLYAQDTADEARVACRAMHIDVLVTRAYDPIWQNRASWVWTLPALVSDKEFRALYCH